MIRTANTCCTTLTKSSATSRTASIVANARCATSVTTTATRMSAKTAEATRTVDPPTTTLTISALGGMTAGTPTFSTVQSTGTAVLRREPTSSAPPDLSTSRTRCSAIGRTGLTVEAGLLVTSVMKTANKKIDFQYFNMLFQHIF